MPNPTISIVTTVYDAKDYIPRTVRSILAQSFTDFELLLVDCLLYTSVPRCPNHPPPDCLLPV